MRYIPSEFRDVIPVNPTGSMFICNTAGFGDTIATTAAIHELSKIGVRVSFGCRLNNPSGAMFANNTEAALVGNVLRESHGEYICDPDLIESFDGADHRVNQSYYMDDGRQTFYEARLSQVGIDHTKLDPKEITGRLWINAEHKAIALGWMAANNLQPGRFIVVHPGATSPRRRWSANATAEFARMCWGVELPVVQVWSKHFEIPMRSEHIIPVDGDWSLSVACALCDYARLLVVTDSLFSHISLALQKPSVLLASGEASAEIRIAKHHKHLKWLRDGQLSDGMAGIHPVQAFKLTEELLCT